MQELSTMLRGTELQRIVETKVSEWRERGLGSKADKSESYQRVNFRRHTNRRKNNEEISRIIAKYSRPRQGTHVQCNTNSKTGNNVSYIPNINNTPSIKPVAPSRKKNLHLSISRSESNLLTMVEAEKSPQITNLAKLYDSGKFKYRARSQEDVTKFIDKDFHNKSTNFEERSILSDTKYKRIEPPPRLRGKNDYPSVEICYDEPVVAPRRMFKGRDKRNSCGYDLDPGSDFVKCKTRSVSVDNLMKAASEPSVLELSDEVSPSKTKEAKKRWTILKQPFRKGTFDCLTLWRGRKTPVVEERIREVDDSFFEKFGSILKQASQRAAIAEATPLAPLKEEVEKTEDDLKSAEEGDGEERKDSDSGHETMLDTDSEPEEEKMEMVVEEAVGWNMDELYAEILYEIIHNVGGCDQGLEVGTQAMLSYIQEAFKVSYDRHNLLLTQAEAKEPPDIMLNVEVVEAKELVSKDPNGLSDPFVTIFLMSNPVHRYNTSVKSGTLNPTWEEHFSLPVSENANEDTLCLEVWDFDPAETVKEKMTKLFEVKGVRGLRKLMKEIAVTASTGKHDNEFIGRARIPLKSIPAGGMTMWYTLDKKNSLRRQGVVKIRLGFSSEKNRQVAAQEHRHLLRVLLLHELDNSKVAPHWWSGNFSAPAEAIITQHAAQSGLSMTENYLCQWSVYCAVHSDHPLAYSLFIGLLDKLLKPVKSGVLSDEETRIFWDGGRKLLCSCFALLRKLRRKTAGDNAVVKTLREVLNILYRLSSIDVPDSLELFPPSLYGWLRREDQRLSILEVLHQAVTQGASDWFVHLLDNNQCRDSSEHGRLQHLLMVIQLIRSDLQRAVEYHDRIFIELMNFPYARALYGLYEGKIASLVEPEVTEVCKSMKRLQYEDDGSVQLAGGLDGGSALGAPKLSSEPLSMGTTLFELYLALQRFLALGQGLNETEWSSYAISKFHAWFYGGVAQWLDIAAYKALTRIEKAVDLDQLTPVDATVKYSSSGVDTLAIFYQIKIFWQQLNWPDVEGCYTFVAKIIDDICRCCVFYADRMAGRVRDLGTVSTVFENRFEVTTEWCMAINNIDYVRQSLRPFIAELSMDDIINRMCELRTPVEAQRCKETLENVVENAIDTVKNKIIELLEIMVKKMMPSITRFLVEGAELLHQDSGSMERVMRYLDANLSTLYANLNNENFSRTLDIVWDQLSAVLYDLIQANLEKRRPPSFFANLHECVKIMVRSFRQDDKEVYSSEALQRVEYLLKLHGLETRELIHQYHLERWQEQQSITEPPMGSITVRAQFIDNNLKIEIMNARNLVPTDSNGLCDSYVRVALIPEDTFADVIKPKTQTHNKTLFPLYDEMFLITLKPEQASCKDGLVQLVVKDKDLFSVSNQFIGEAYLHFSEIQRTPAPITSLPQVHLPLSKPGNIDGDAMKALETRQGDKQAREFVKKQRQKGPPSSGKFGFSLT